MRPDPSPAGERAVAELNRAHYDTYLSRAHVWPHHLWPEWPAVRSLLPERGRVLEIGAGARPRTPLTGSFYADLAAGPVRTLVRLGAQGTVADACRLPYRTAAFALLVAAEVLEHIADDRAALFEWARVLEPGGRLLLTTPLHRDLWTALDPLIGHVRRYEPPELRARLEDAGLRVDHFSARRIPLYRFTQRVQAWAHRASPRLAIWAEDRVIRPLALRFAAGRDARPGLPPPGGEEDGRAAGALVIATRR